MANKASRGLVLYGDSLAPLISPSHTHFHSLAFLSSCALLSLPNSPPSACMITHSLRNRLTTSSSAMATPKLLALSKSLLRRHRATSLPLLYHCQHFSSQPPRHHHRIPRPAFAAAVLNFHVRHLTPYNFQSIRSLSTSDSEELISSIDIARTGGLQVDSVIEEAIFPVGALTSLLDGYHDLTGFPWWLVIASATFAMRFTLFPFVVLQLRKLKTIGEVFPKLPPPFPPPLSRRSFKDQLALFRKEKNDVGCPSFLWFLASIAVQVPLFLLWITTFRRMSLNHHPGFDCGGIFWFQNLTEYPNGALGPIFPLLIAGLHYVNVQISFRNSSLGKTSGVIGKLAKYYKLYLEVITVPLLLITFNIPQGSLIYWLTNSSLSVVQQLTLQHPDVRNMLGLPNKAPVEEIEVDAIDKASVEEIELDAMEKGGGVKDADESGGQQKVSVLNLSPNELVALSVTYLAKGEKDRVIKFLRLALEKDPECIRALLLLGQTFLQKNQLTEAIEYFEQAISKLLAAGHPTEAEDVDNLILSSIWAGTAYMRQGKNEDGMVHLERLAGLEELEDAKGKTHYYDGLLMLSSALAVMGRKEEAVVHLRRAVAYDPNHYQRYLDQFENEDDVTNELVSSRRDS